MNKYCILIRDPNDEYGEKAAMQELGIRYIENRAEAAQLFDAYKTTIIGRYSVLPYYKELEEDLKCLGTQGLINSHEQYRYCSDLGNWYKDFAPLNLTPQTWFSLAEYLSDIYEGPVILKGETNSRRDKWFTHMFALNKNEAREVYCKLLDDGLIGQQQIYIRKYEPLKKLIDGVNGMPIPNEWRIFVLYGEVIGCEFYWSTYLDDIKELGITPEPPYTIDVKRIRNLVGDNSNFYTADIAQKEDGEWTLIEINEGQMSGLNGIDRKEFYTNMKKILDSRSER